MLDTFTRASNRVRQPLEIKNGRAPKPSYRHEGLLVSTL
jgi:hypothetical protein